MNLLDYLILILTLYFLGLGIYKGFIKSVFSALGLIAGIFIAYQFSPNLTRYLKQITTLPNWADQLVFLLVAICVYLVFKALGNLITAGAKMVALGSINSLLGGLIGFLKAAIILLILAYSYTFILEVTSVSPPKLAKDSILLPHILNALNLLTSLL